MAAIAAADDSEPQEYALHRTPLRSGGGGAVLSTPPPYGAAEGTTSEDNTASDRLASLWGHQVAYGAAASVSSPSQLHHHRYDDNNSFIVRTPPLPQSSSPSPSASRRGRAAGSGSSPRRSSSSVVVHHIVGGRTGAVDAERLPTRQPVVDVLDPQYFPSTARYAPTGEEQHNNTAPLRAASTSPHRFAHGLGAVPSSTTAAAAAVVVSPRPTRVFVNSPLRPDSTPSKAARLVHSPAFVVPTHASSASSSAAPIGMNASPYGGVFTTSAAAAQPYTNTSSSGPHGATVDAIPLSPLPEPGPYGHDESSPTARSQVASPARRAEHPNYGGEFLYRDTHYYSTRAGDRGVIVASVDERPPAVLTVAATSSSAAAPVVRYALMSTADKGIALKVIRCCIFSDHLTDADFVRRIRFPRTDARRLFESMTVNDSWSRGSPASTTPSHVLLHNCFTEVLKGCGAPVDWARWFNGVSRRRVEEAFKRTTAHVEALGLVLDRNSRGFLVQLKQPPHRIA